MNRCRNKSIAVADFLSCLDHVSFFYQRFADGTDVLAEHYCDFFDDGARLDSAFVS